MADSTTVIAIDAAIPIIAQLIAKAIANFEAGGSATTDAEIAAALASSGATWQQDIDDATALRNEGHENDPVV